MKTISTRQEDVDKKWILIDATDAVVGRLASFVASRLRGKHLVSFTPHVDDGDYVVIINAEKIHLTGNKITDKKYYRHTGYPGGIKKISFKDQLDKDPEKIIRDAIKGMLPKNKLNRQIIKKLKVYNDEVHPHEAQNPEVIE